MAALKDAPVPTLQDLVQLLFSGELSVHRAQIIIQLAYNAGALDAKQKRRLQELRTE
jgi:hypothetical protein